MVTATAQDTANEALGNGPAWYLVARCDALKRGKQIRRILAGKPVLIGRRSEGDVFAMRDVCPHRLVPLSAGRQVETEGETTVECPYHGWRFGTDGVCRLIPSLMEDDPYKASSFKVARYSVMECAGGLFVAEAPEASRSTMTFADRLGAPRLWVSEPLTLPENTTSADLIDHAPLVSGFGWAAEPSGWTPASLAARRFSDRPAQLERASYGDGVLHERLTAGAHHLDLLLALTPEGPARMAGHLLIWWRAPATFALGTMDLRMGARSYLRSLQAGLSPENSTEISTGA